MGKVSATAIREGLVRWSLDYRPAEKTIEVATSAHLASVFEGDLKAYFALAALSRAKTADLELREKAMSQVFRVRVSLERAIIQSVRNSLAPVSDRISDVLSGSFFGFSKKQGASLRMPLSSCTPTSMCAGACYAHDVLDATPLAVVRGAVNGWLAGLFENSALRWERDITKALVPHVRKAVQSATRELKNLPKGYSRRPFIRFSHVGEVVHYPNFANALATLVKSESNNAVDCVIYTRHRNVVKLDPSLWIINFTLDPASLDRQAWAPAHARIVFSAFNGITSNLAEVNFLEHHRHIHMARSSGDGRICPATKPETKIRTCDACRCNRCFVKPTQNPDADTRPAGLVSTS